MNAPAPRRPWALWLTLPVAALALGCGASDLETRYGVRSGPGQSSVNGLFALGEMFKTAGHRVRSWRVMSPSLAKADVIVWAPDATWSSTGPNQWGLAPSAPSPEARAWLDAWLLHPAGGKTLIWIGPTHRAEELYWDAASRAAPAAERAAYRSRRTTARIEQRALYSQKPVIDACEGWFTLHASKDARRVRGLRGPWAEGVDARRAGVVSGGCVRPDERAQTLLADASGRPLVSQLRVPDMTDDWAGVWDEGAEVDPAAQGAGSRVVVVENASFLLNASLVNHEHRKLAGRLVAHVGPPRRDVVFLEADAAPEVQEADPSDLPPTGLALLSVWPLGLVLTQFAAAGLVYALWRWPIFGEPRRLRQGSLTDFGQHVDALGRLLAATRDRAYAYAQVHKHLRPRDEPPA